MALFFYTRNIPKSYLTEIKLTAGEGLGIFNPQLIYLT